MTETIRREMVFPQTCEHVWQAITDPAVLAEWMFPNDFEPRVGHTFTFRVPANPGVKFDGLVVRCKVLTCDPPGGGGGGGGRLAFSWSAGVLADTEVTFRLEPEGAGTRCFFEHSSFDLAVPFGMQAFKGAALGWANMFKRLAVVAAERSGSDT